MGHYQNDATEGSMGIVPVLPMGRSPEIIYGILQYIVNDRPLFQSTTGHGPVLVPKGPVMFGRRVAGRSPVGKPEGVLPPPASGIDRGVGGLLGSCPLFGGVSGRGRVFIFLSEVFTRHGLPPEQPALPFHQSQRLLPRA